jgi:tmRNA-binding protein
MNENPEAVPEKNVVVNRRARHEYHFVERYEVGIALVGSEVKSQSLSTRPRAQAKAAHALVRDTQTQGQGRAEGLDSDSPEGLFR